MLGLVLVLVLDVRADDSGVRLRFDGSVAWTDGSRTNVRENDFLGNYLSLSRDLGIDVAGSAAASVGYRFNADNLLALSLESLFLYGSARIPQDFTHNGTTFQGGTQLESRPLWLVLSLDYEHDFLHWGEDDRGRLGFDVGIRLDYLHWYFNGTPVPTSARGEQGEGFARQATPIPYVGLSLRQPLAPEWDLVAFARGFRANHWDSGRAEGGEIYFWESYVEAFLGAAWRVSDLVELTAGYRFLYVDIAERSREDGNYMTLLTHGLLVGVTLSF